MSDSKWDSRFLDTASLTATWSKQNTTKVGCVIVDDKRRMVAAGYNGLPRGVEDTVERLADRETKLAMTVHAEENALLYAGRGVEGCTAYITHPPCSLCMAKLIQCGIARVVYCKPMDSGFLVRWGDSLKLAQVMAQEAGVVLEQSAQTQKQF